MFWAPSLMLDRRMALETSPNAVNGGQTTMSTSLTLVSSRWQPLTRSTASATVLFIFQLPAMINFRSFCMSFIRKRRHTGQHFPLQKFQARAAAGAHEGDLIAKARTIDCSDGIAAA